MSDETPGALTPESPRVPDVAEQVVAMVRTSEPVSRSVLAGLRSTGFSALTLWGISALAPGLYPPEQIAVLSTGIGLMELARRRSGETFPSSVFRVGGAAMVGAGVMVTAVSLARDERESLALGAILLLGGAAAIVVGLRKYRALAAQAARLAVPVEASQRIPRSELAQRLERQRAEAMGKGKRALWAFFGSIGVFAAALFVPDLLGVAEAIPDAVYGGLLAAFWVSIGGFIWKGHRDARKLAERFGTLCPECRKPLADGFGNKRLLQMLDEAGLCPHCGVKITED